MKKYVQVQSLVYRVLKTRLKVFQRVFKVRFKGI